MKFSLNWIKEFVTISLTPDELVEKLTMAGLEVEGVEQKGELLHNIVTARIESISKHPNADKLVITNIFDGEETLQVVTGASNINEGDIVPLARIGGVVDNGLTLKATKLRGIDSFGMLCSKSECGAEEESEGIWILDKQTPVGVDFIKYYQLKDTVLDIAILPNRGDCQSIIGLAREIAAITGEQLKLPEITLTTESISNPYQVSVQDSTVCPLYVGRYITNIQNGASPFWMQQRLEHCGIRSIDRVVDITNYVLLEMGHPLHAFDHHKLTSNIIKIGSLETKQTMTTLDDIDRSIEPGQCLIFDDNQPVAIAGVMGAQNTGVASTTQEIFLEAAYFLPKHIRRSSQQAGCRTDSSIRFEKGININTVEMASKRAAQLLQTLAKATISQDVIIKKDEQNERFKPLKVAFNADQINQLLGSHFQASEMQTYLQTLGFVFETEQQVTVPSWRQEDIKEWPCLAEEIIRLKGFDHISASNQALNSIQESSSKHVKKIDQTIDFFVQNGFIEINTYPMINEDQFKSVSESNPTQEQQLANPISPELAMMRPLMLPSTLAIIQYHLKRQQTQMSFVEVGKVFDSLGKETTHLSAAITGSHYKDIYSSSQKDVSDDIFHTLLGIVKRWNGASSLTIQYKQKEKPQWAHPTCWMNILVNKKICGSVALLHPNQCLPYQINQPIAYVECQLDGFVQQSKQPIRYKPFSRFPSTRRDIALVVPRSMTYESIMSCIQQFKHKTVIDVSVFDVFESEKLGPDCKSVALSMTYQDNKGTLSDDKVNQAHQRLCDRLVKELGVTIR